MTDYSNFPTVQLTSRDPLYRIHASHHEPGYYCNCGHHRFDPPPQRSADFGVCYTGLDPLTSFVERFGRHPSVFEDLVSATRLSTAIAERDLVLGDLTDRLVLGQFGITAAVSTGGNYDEAQELACELFDVGLDGLLYRARHDPAMELGAVALFGTPGLAEADTVPIKWRSPSPIPEEVKRDGRQFGLVVQPRPRPDELHRLD